MATMEPTPEQVSAWIGSVLDCANDGEDLLDEHGVFLAMRVARHAYAAGADAELEACSDWLAEDGYSVESNLLRAARRPKPPRLQDARVALDALCPDFVRGDNPHFETLARFLNSLPDD